MILKARRRILSPPSFIFHPFSTIFFSSPSVASRTFVNRATAKKESWNRRTEYFNGNFQLKVNVEAMRMFR